MNFKTLDLNLLVVLDALLREGSTIKAGLRLGMSQSAVSGALSRLRLALDDDLFLRRGQGIEPTDYATSLAVPLRLELERIEVLLTKPKLFDPASAAFGFRIAASDFFAELLMPQLAEVLCRLAPGVKVQMVELSPQNHMESLEVPGTDLLLVPKADVPDWVDWEPIFRNRFVVIARAGNPAIQNAAIAPGATLPLDAYCDLGHIVFSPAGNAKTMGDEALARIGRARKVMMSLPVFSAVCRAVSVSDGVALVPKGFADLVGPALGLLSYEAPMPVPKPLIIAAWRKASTENPAHRWMRGQIETILRALHDDAIPLLDAPPGR